MKRYRLAFLLFLPSLVGAGSQQPPFEEKNWETNENMRAAFIAVDELQKKVDVLTPAVVNITISTPTAVGQIVITSAYVVYISTNITDVKGWVKVGSQ
jgi:hypothetical protein